MTNWHTFFGWLRRQDKDCFAHAGDFCHFTELANLPSIQEHGAILSRAAARKLAPNFKDTTDERAQALTDDEVEKYARFYWAPRNATLWLREGWRPRGRSHRPTLQPVYLVASPDVLDLPNVRISTSSVVDERLRLLRPPDLLRIETDHFKEIERFREIYARSAEGRNHRGHQRPTQAELLIPKRLPLSHVRAVVCRSEADAAFVRATCPTLRAKVSVEEEWFFGREAGCVWIVGAAWSDSQEPAVQIEFSGPVDASVSLTFPDGTASRRTRIAGRVVSVKVSAALEGGVPLKVSVHVDEALIELVAFLPRRNQRGRSGRKHETLTALCGRLRSEGFRIEDKRPKGGCLWIYDPDDQLPDEVPVHGGGVFRRIAAGGRLRLGEAASSEEPVAPRRSLRRGQDE